MCLRHNVIVPGAVRPAPAFGIRALAAMVNCSRAVPVLPLREL
jgi:hypothetical protein